MVFSREILVNKALTSNEIIFNFVRILSFFNLVIKSFVFNLVCFNFLSGANNSARYLAISYVEFPTLEVIGLKISLSTPFLSLSLRTLAVPVLFEVNKSVYM